MNESNSDDVREVESLEAAFREDLQRELADLPRVAEALERQERTQFNLTPVEINYLTIQMVWLLAGWVRSLASEIDRLSAELDKQANAGQNLDSEQ
jgi:hypothetical protein